MTGTAVSRGQRLRAPVIAVAATAVVALVGVVVPQAVPSPAGPETVVEARTTTICAVSADDKRAGELIAGAVADDGTLTLRELAGQGGGAGRLTGTGVVATRTTPTPYTVTATGDMTGTAAGVLVGHRADGADRGLAAQTCQLAGTQHWLVGLGAGKGHFSTVLLTNPDAQAAEVELRVHGPRGPVTAPGSSGIAVPPHVTVAIPLEGMVSAEGPLAVEVRATAGRVSAIAQDRHRSGTDPAGSDWVPPAGAPASELVIPGVPRGAGERDLVLANPGERTATVRVEALTDSGAFTLEGADAVDVPPASTVRVALADALGGEDAGLRITADQPVAAALLAGAERSGHATDTAVAVPTAPMRSPLVLPVVASSGVGGRVVVTNPGPTSAAATVVLRDRAGKELGRKDIEVGADATVGVDATGSGVWAEVVTAVGTRLHVAVVLASDRDRVAGLAWLPGDSPRVGGELPPVRRDPQVAR